MPDPMSSGSDHGHENQVAAYGRCVTCTAAASTLPASTGTERRDDALLAVETGAPLSWLIEARQVIAELAATGREWTSDDVWARLAQPPEPRALGAAIRQFAQSGVICGTGRSRPSSRPDCHARPVAVWVGVVSASRHPQVVDEPVEQALWSG